MSKPPKIVKVQNGIAIAIEYCCICENGYSVKKPLDDVGMSFDVCPDCSKHIMRESYNPDIDYSYGSCYDHYEEEDLEDFDETEEGWQNFYD